jgi:hypothetical protein
MIMDEVSHKQIYDRLIAVEAKVDEIDNNTKGLVTAFNAAQGAFTVLEFLGKLAKPLLWLAGVIALVGTVWQGLIKK